MGASPVSASGEIVGKADSVGKRLNNARELQRRAQYGVAMVKLGLVTSRNGKALRSNDEIGTARDT